MYSFIITARGLTLVHNKRVYNVATTHANYDRIMDAVRANEDGDSVVQLIDLEKSVVAYGQGNVSVVDGAVLYKGNQLHNVVAERILDMMREGFDIQPLVKFLTNLMENPSKTAIDELYLFMEAGRIPITPDGHILAYKRVRDDYFDKHSATLLNKPFSELTEEEKDLFPYTINGVTAKIVNNEVVLEMQRNAVDDRRDNTCSYGLHFCSLDYLKSFGAGKTVVVKINPADVVSIPSDYNNTKGRTCRYVVSATLNMIDDEDEQFTSPVMDTVYDEVVDASYEDGYVKGYKDGRAKVPFHAVAVGRKSEYDAGYESGYKDGRGHKPRQY